MGIKQPSSAGSGFCFDFSLLILDEDAPSHCFERFQGWNFLNLTPIAPGVTELGIQQAGIQSGLIAEKEQSLGICIEPTNGMNSLGKTKSGQRAVPGSIRSELGEDSVGFVKGKDHCRPAATRDVSSRRCFLNEKMRIPTVNSNQNGRKPKALPSCSCASDPGTMRRARAKSRLMPA